MLMLTLRTAILNCTWSNLVAAEQRANSHLITETWEPCIRRIHTSPEQTASL